MNYYSIGSILKDLRKSRKISQKELSNGICTQGQLSRIERGEFIPHSITLFELTKRLGVDINYIFKKAQHSRSDYIENTHEIIRQLVRQRNYVELAHLIKIERNNPLFEQPDLKQFLLWHEGIAVYHVEKDSEKALDLMYQALHMTTVQYNQRSINIMNSIAIIHQDEQEFEKSIEILHEGLNYISQSPDMDNPLIRIRLHFNLERGYRLVQKHEEAIRHAHQAIRLCKRLETTYFLGDLYYHCALNMIAVDEEQEDIEEMLHNALSIFKLQEKDEFCELVQKKLDELPEYQEHKDASY